MNFSKKRAIFVSSIYKKINAYFISLNNFNNLT